MAFLFARKKTPPKTQHFHRYHSDWVSSLSSTHLPLLRRSMSSLSPPSLLPSAIESLSLHLSSYYDSLDSSSSSSPHLIFPLYRSPLESPFLWLGDLHPYLFTNLLRSFIDHENENDEEPGFEIGQRSDLFERNWNIIMAWRNPNEGLMNRIDQIECGLRLMVPSLSARAREAQARFVERVGTEWGRRGREKVRTGIGEAMEAEMEEITGVFVDANRLRKSVIADIMSAVDVYQGALFLEGLAEFLVGFRDSELVSEFERCKVAIN